VLLIGQAITEGSTLQLNIQPPEESTEEIKESLEGLAKMVFAEVKQTVAVDTRCFIQEKETQSRIFQEYQDDTKFIRNQ
jgi:hypothetical protein